MLKPLALQAIRRYQRRGGSKRFFNTECNFQPSCSEYTYQAIEKYGLLRGCQLGWRRICRCNNPDCVEPLADPVPDLDTGSSRRQSAKKHSTRG